ncbi:MAG: DUF2934 domain-containing protein [bacterium]|nr:DUF2934 domain-containing protein [bacterium]
MHRQATRGGVRTDRSRAPAVRGARRRRHELLSATRTGRRGRGDGDDRPQPTRRELAYDLWVRRGRPLGSPEEDWHAAERRLADDDRLLRDYAGGLVLEAAEG